MTLDNPTGWLSTVNRIRTLLFAVFFSCLGHGLLAYLVPVTLDDNGVSDSLIGVVLSLYSVGFFFGCFFGNKVISRVGHIRTYSIMASLVAISALLHSFYGGFVYTAVIRLMTGMAIASIYITLESWLNGASSSTTRATIYGIYQTSVAIGFSLSPWFLSLFREGDARQFSLVAVLLAVSLIPLTISRRPAPQLPESSSMYSFRQLFLDSPSAVIGSFGGALIALPATQLMIIFATESGYSGTQLALILSCAFVGSLLFQIPVGKCADAFDKRKIYLALLIILVLVSGGILANNWLLHSIWVLAACYLVFVGCCNCLHPLSVTLLFDQIHTKNAVSATASMTVVHSIGLILGPLVAGVVMEQFGSVMLFGYAIVIALLLGLFLICRIFVLHISIGEERLPYVMSIQNLRPTSINLNPNFEYLITQIDDPAFTSLVKELRAAHARDYPSILRGSLFQAGLTPLNTVLNLVLSMPRQCDDILKAMIKIHPELRDTLAIELHDLIGLDKKRINALLLKGLCYKATRKERNAIRRYFDKSIEEEKGRMKEKNTAMDGTPSIL